MGSFTFDAWQEISHCQPEIVALVNKDHPEITEYEDAKFYLSTLIDPVVCMNGRSSEKNKELASYSQGLYGSFQGVISDAIAERVYGEILAYRE